jgi:hypothetical protein
MKIKNHKGARRKEEWLENDSPYSGFKVLYIEIEQKSQGNPGKLQIGEHLSQMNITELFYRLVFYEQLTMFDHHINTIATIKGYSFV